MKIFRLPFVALVVAFACGFAKASLIYQIDISGVSLETPGVLTPNMSIRGTITTDGTIGSILAENVVAWNLIVSTPDSAFAISQYDPSAQVTCDPVAGCGIIASDSELTLASVSPGTSTYPALAFTGCSATTVCFAELAGEINYSSEYWLYYAADSGKPAIKAPVSCEDGHCMRLNSDTLGLRVPEPGTQTLVALGLGGLVLWRRKVSPRSQPESS